MKCFKKETAPRYYRQQDRITSYLLASPRTSDAEYLTTTWVEIKPGGQQRTHSHIPEQTYYILEGHGVMTVGDEIERVGPGDYVFIPSGQPHGLQNDAEVPLRYFSAAAPAFEREELENLWPLESETEAST